MGFWVFSLDSAVDYRRRSSCSSKKAIQSDPGMFMIEDTPLHAPKPVDSPLSPHHLLPDSSLIHCDNLLSALFL